MKNYKFKSDLLKTVLPLGVTAIEHVRRDEVSGYLEALKKAAIKSDYLEMFVHCRVEDTDGWTEESISKRLACIRADINALKWRLANDRR